MRSLQRGFISPRSMFIVVVLLAMLIIPLWWLGGRSDQVAKHNADEAAKNTGTVTAAVTAAVSTEVNDPNAFGMTWGLMQNDKLPDGAAWMSCHGQPRDGITQPHADSCNPYKGDSSCRLSLPILCIRKDGSTVESVFPSGASAEPLKDERARGALSFHDIVTDGWGAGSVASTEPLAGFVIGSLELANARCEKQLGPGWRMASFHDGAGGRGGWGFVAKRGDRLDSRQRHWVHINDQPGNCWNNKG